MRAFYDNQGWLPPQPGRFGWWRSADAKSPADMDNRAVCPEKNHISTETRLDMTGAFAESFASL
jgi:hypothetical protein